MTAEDDHMVAAATSALDDIEELTTQEQCVEAFGVMRELRTELDRDDYARRLETMREEGYRLFALRSHGDIVSLAGVRTGTNLYYGRYLWVDDLVTLAALRSQGHGAALLVFIGELARAEGCDVVALSSGLQRTDAHRFYETVAGYKRVSYVFTKELGGEDER